MKFATEVITKMDNIEYAIFDPQELHVLYSKMVMIIDYCVSNSFIHLVKNLIYTLVLYTIHGYYKFKFDMIPVQSIIKYMPCHRVC